VFGRSIVNIKPPRARRHAALGTMVDNVCGGYGSSTAAGAQEGARLDLCCLSGKAPPDNRLLINRR
jgi:hypothetical protein